jgi:hypothetical protein
MSLEATLLEVAFLVVMGIQIMGAPFLDKKGNGLR